MKENDNIDIKHFVLNMLPEEIWFSAADIFNLIFDHYDDNINIPSLHVCLRSMVKQDLLNTKIVDITLGNVPTVYYIGEPYKNYYRKWGRNKILLYKVRLGTKYIRTCQTRITSP